MRHKEGYQMTNKEAIEIIQERIDFKNKEFLEKHVPEYAEALRLAVKALEQKEWIPCSERLPEEREWMGTKSFGTTISDNVLVTVRYKDGSRNVKCEHFRNGELPQSPLTELRGVPDAWMPLPEPYRSDI